MRLPAIIRYSIMPCNTKYINPTLQEVLTFFLVIIEHQAHRFQDYILYDQPDHRRTRPNERNSYEFAHASPHRPSTVVRRC